MDGYTTNAFILNKTLDVYSYLQRQTVWALWTLRMLDSYMSWGWKLLLPRVWQHSLIAVIDAARRALHSSSYMVLRQQLDRTSGNSRRCKEEALASDRLGGRSGTHVPWTVFWWDREYIVRWRVIFIKKQFWVLRQSHTNVLYVCFCEHSVHLKEKQKMSPSILELSLKITVTVRWRWHRLKEFRPSIKPRISKLFDSCAKRL